MRGSFTVVDDDIAEDSLTRVCMLQIGTLFSRYKNGSTWKNSMPIWDVQSVVGECSTVSSSTTVEVAVILTLQG